MLNFLREKALQMMLPFQELHIEGLVYGSIARGDINSRSDIDVFLPSPPSPEIIEAYLEKAGINSIQREIVQATPSYAAKGYIFTDELRCYSFPIVRMRQTERDFYSFAGSLNYLQLIKGLRIAGVDKRLMLIEPTDQGHTESKIIGREGEVARILNVDLRIVSERVRTLLRRQKIGRTGVYLNRYLSSEESFSEVFNELLKIKPALRRRIRN